MPSSAPSRKDTREALAALLDTAFDSSWDVFNFKTKKFGDKAKNIVVTSAGSERVISGSQGVTPDSTFRFRVFVFILYQSAVESWTDHNSDDALDAAEKTITDVCADNQINALWGRLRQEGFSDPDMIVDEGGQTFRREIINIVTQKLS